VRGKQSFLGGALVLGLAGLFSRVLGAGYRIPLYRLLGREGVGLFQMAHPVYGLVLVLSTTGINVAVSKLVAEKMAAGDEAGAWRAFRVSFALLTIMGLALSVALVLAAEPIATYIVRDQRARLSIMAISPAVFFVSVMAAYRGLFQGLQQMTPTAVSQVVEQLARVATTLVLAYILRPRGVEYASAGAAFGAVTGAVVGLAYVVLVYYRMQPRAHRPAVPHAAGVPVHTVMSRIVHLAVPVSLAGGILGVMQLLDLVLVPARLRAAGFAGDQITALYGQLSGGAVPLVNMPTVLSAALQVSLVPAVSAALAGGSLARVRDRAQTALRVTFLLMLPAVVGLYVLSREIPYLLFGDAGIGVPLAAMAAGTLFLALQQATSGVLQGMGDTVIPVRSLLVGVLAKALVTYTLTAIPALGIRGAALGTVAGFLVTASLNLTAVTVRLGPVIQPVDMILKPGFAALTMGVIARLLYEQLVTALGNANLATVFAMGGGMVSYGVVILLIGGIRGSDLNLLPVVGPRLRRAMERVGWM
jgi:stage V sporulation protein B